MTEYKIVSNIPLDLESFLKAANSTRKTRLFACTDWNCLWATIRDVLAGKFDYVEHDAGVVANSYKYPAYTAHYGVYRDTDGAAVVWVGESRCNGRHTACRYFGGERAYRSDFKHAQKSGEILRVKFPH